jgi:oligopeptide/dipeptide ABC transporter ATP-binding protein
MSGETLVSVSGLTVHFPVRGSRETVKAVDGVDFSVTAGTTFGVIGESGSGKSTLGRALVCLQYPTAGRIVHAGRDPFALPGAALRRHRRDYQIIFQDPGAALNPRMTILDSVREPLDIARAGSARERAQQARAMLDRVGIGSMMHDRFPHELSGGQKQRVNIARALTVRPRLIVCDEVVAALDVSIQADILNLFADLQQDFGLTYVFITHDLAVVTHVSDMIAVMYLGRFMEIGPAETIYANPTHPYTMALLSAEPEPLPRAMQSDRRIMLRGEIPSPIAPPSGCRFRTRCPYAEPICAAVEPPWRETTPGRFAACHFAGTGARITLPEHEILAS